MPKIEAFQDAVFARDGVTFGSVFADYIGVFQIKNPQYKQQELEQHAIKMRGCASRRNQAWTSGAQVNRAGRKSPGRTGGGDVAGDFSSMFTANKVLVYDQSPVEEKLGIACLSFEKNRNDGKRQVLIAQNYAGGQYAMTSALMSRDYDKYMDQKGKELGN